MQIHKHNRRVTKTDTTHLEAEAVVMGIEEEGVAVMVISRMEATTAKKEIPTVKKEMHLG